MPNALNVRIRSGERATTVNGCGLRSLGSLSPNQSPGPSRPTVVEPRRSSAVPERISENVATRSPSRTSSAPASARVSITGPASERTSRQRTGTEHAERIRSGVHASRRRVRFQAGPTPPGTVRRRRSLRAPPIIEASSPTGPAIPRHLPLSPQGPRQTPFVPEVPCVTRTPFVPGAPTVPSPRRSRSQAASRAVALRFPGSVATGRVITLGTLFPGAPAGVGHLSHG